MRRITWATLASAFVATSLLSPAASAAERESWDAWQDYRPASVGTLDGGTGLRSI
jgi:hypothetical protein